MSLGRCEEGEVEKEGTEAELSREEPEDVEGESGGVACRSAAWWSNGQAWDISRDEELCRACRGGVGDASRIKKRMKARVGCASAAGYDCVGSCGRTVSSF